MKCARCQKEVEKNMPQDGMCQNCFVDLVENRARKALSGKNLKKGDKILFYTDGLTEAQNHVNEDFENHLEKFMLDYAHLPIDDFLNNIYYQLVLFKGNEKFLDDVCIVGIEILL